jgi:hypothetical protein
VGPLPVTADDLSHAVQLAVAALREAPPAAWDRKAGTLEWDCWETVEHLSDDLFAYAVQIGPRTPPYHGALAHPVVGHRARRTARIPSAHHLALVRHTGERSLTTVVGAR